MAPDTVRVDEHGAGPAPCRRPDRTAAVSGGEHPAAPAARPVASSAEPRRWFQHAVFYEVLLRGFYDSNNDGIGDIRGLHEKLDYLQWLGVDAIWLLPFYPSPMRDGGYDISDFFNVAPDYGTLGDLTRLLDDAHRRGHPVRRRPGDEPHERRPPLVHRVALEPRQPEERLVRVERRRPALARGPHRLHRRRAVQLDLGRHPPAVLLAPLLLAPARPQLREPRGRRRHGRDGQVLARDRLRRVPARRRPVPVPARRHRR